MNLLFPQFTRRDLLRTAGAMTALFPFKSRLLSEIPEIPSERLALIDEIERRACLFFYEEAHPRTGLVLDRARTNARDTRKVASIAATGFGLSALCIADQRGFLQSSTALQRAERTLEFLAHHAARNKGFYYHFLDAETGKRTWGCELSSVDTTWLLCGAIHARQHFDTRRVRNLVNEIVNRVEWNWMCNGGATLCHGWTPEKGFLAYRWDRYSELLAMYLLAMASRHYPIPASAWHAWERPRIEPEKGQPFIESGAPLFVHQYSHAWFDFRDRRDGSIDYFQNSRLATVLHRDFCVRLRDRFPWFGEDMWGITASDSRYGYIDWGGPSSPANSKIDGTLVPCASGGSLVFLPDDCSRVLETMLSRYGKQVWTRYGFVDAFHPKENWRSPDVIGIDLGIMLLMAENFRTQAVWEAMLEAPEVQRGFQIASFAQIG